MILRKVKDLIGGSGVRSGAGRGFVSLDKARVDCGSEEEVGPQGRRRLDLGSHFLLCLHKQPMITTIIIFHPVYFTAFPASMSLRIITVAPGREARISFHSRL